MDNFTAGFKIISGFDGQGITEAKKGLAEVSQSAGNTSANMGQAGQASQVLTQKQQQLRGAATATAGAVGALSGALGQGAGGLATVARGTGAVMAGLAGGPIGLLIAGIAAIIAIYTSAKNKIKEANEEMQKGAVAYQKVRLDTVVSQYDRVTKSIERATTASLSLNSASSKADAAKTNETIGQVEAYGATQINQASSPEGKEKARLEMEKQIALVRNESDKTQAQYAENAARTKIEAAMKEKQIAEDYVATLKKEYGQTSLKPDVAKKIEDAQNTAQDKGSEVSAAQYELNAATSNLSAVRTKNLLVESEANTRIDEYSKKVQKAIDTKNEISALDEESVELQKDLNTAVKYETEVRAEFAKAEAQRNKAMSTSPTAFIGDREAKREEKKQLLKDREAADKKAANLENRKDAGTKISKKDKQWLTDYNDQKSLQKMGKMGSLEDSANNFKAQQKVLENTLTEIQKQTKLLQDNLQAGN